MPRACARRRRRAGSRGIFAAATALSLCAPGAGAQETGPNKVLTLRFSGGVEAHSNFALVPGGSDPSVLATTRLGFAYADVTPIDRFEISGDVGLRRYEGPGDRPELTGLTGPSVELSYDRAVPSASLALGAFANRSAVATIDLVEEVILDPDDPLIDPEDLTARANDGTRLGFGASASLRLRRDAPFGIALSAGYRGVRYSDTSDSDLVDSDRINLGVNLRFDIDAATTAGLGLTHLRTRDEDLEVRTTLAFDIGRDISEETSLGLSASVADVASGARYRASVSGRTALPLLDLSASLGTSYLTSGDLLSFEGDLTARREFRTGSLSLSLGRSVRSGEDTQTAVTTVGLGYARALAPLTDVSASVSYARTDPTDGGAASSVGSLGLGLSHALARDWSLSANLRHRFETDDATETARDTVVSFNVTRTLSTVLY